MKKLLYSALFVMSTSTVAQPIVTESTSTNTNVNTSTSVNTSNSTSASTSNSISDTTVKSPPPSAISPSFNTMNNDLCTVGVSAAVQTQILGISGGATVRDMNCERLKLSKTLYDMGMKVAAVSTMCQDERVFSAMMNAGTPCPVDGKIGAEAKTIWEENPNRQPMSETQEQRRNDTLKGMGWGAGILSLLLLLL
jgi:hypothetical protein